mgnify:CR=1 FL=1
MLHWRRGHYTICRYLSASLLPHTGGKIDSLKTISIPTARNQQPTRDPHHAAAVERGKAAVRKLQEQGIIDTHRRRIRAGLPADMQEGNSRDFGG